METQTFEREQKGKVQNVNPEKKINPQHQEGPVAKTIEDETAKLPSDLFLIQILKIEELIRSLLIRTLYYFCNPLTDLSGISIKYN